eukprot:scaffold64877_cov46-Cyclotella_meneghiniana.AAC.1
MGGESYLYIPPVFSTNIVCVWTITDNDSSRTVPMSHHEYDEWYGKGEIGIHCLKWYIQATFVSGVMKS